jgi:hypothetical protein
MKLSSNSPLQKLMNTMPQQGTVNWIGIRPQRKAPLLSLNKVEAITLKGLAGTIFPDRLPVKGKLRLFSRNIWTS